MSLDVSHKVPLAKPEIQISAFMHGAKKALKLKKNGIL